MSQRTLPRLLLPLLFIASFLIAGTQYSYAAFPVKDNSETVLQIHNTVENTPVAPPQAPIADNAKGGLNIAALGLGLFGAIALLIGFTTTPVTSALIVAGGIAAVLAVILGKIGRRGKYAILGKIGSVLGMAGVGALIIVGIFTLLLGEL